jgi:hypothetical protein
MIECYYRINDLRVTETELPQDRANTFVHLLNKANIVILRESVQLQDMMIVFMVMKMNSMNRRLGMEMEVITMTTKIEIETLQKAIICRMRCIEMKVKALLVDEILKLSGKFIKQTSYTYM